MFPLRLCPLIRTRIKHLCVLNSIIDFLFAFENLCLSYSELKRTCNIILCHLNPPSPSPASEELLSNLPLQHPPKMLSWTKPVPSLRPFVALLVCSLLIYLAFIQQQIPPGHAIQQDFAAPALIVATKTGQQMQQVAFGRYHHQWLSNGHDHHDVADTRSVESTDGDVPDITGTTLLEFARKSAWRWSVAAVYHRESSVRGEN